MQSTAPQHPPVRQRILPQVFIPTAAIVIALLALAAIAPDIATRWFTAAKSWAANDAGWFTILAVAGFLVFVVGVAISSYGRIKL
ncbi:BCCT family transporter, partial [Serratia marcescens]